jgi:ornithine cyclodeaminase/alanine dehydrogenase-like protein (mu-crystallin family)
LLARLEAYYKEPITYPRRKRAMETMLGKPLYVSDSQVKRILQASDCMRLARDAYVRLSRRRALNPERGLLSVPGGSSIFTMPAHILGQRTVTVKVARLNPANPQKHRPSVMATVYAYDSTTGTELAQIEAEALTAFRTAASTAVATDLLASRSCDTLGIIGTGEQARAHVPALSKIRGFSRILVYSRSRSHRRRFAAEVSRTSDIPTTQVNSPREVVSSSQVLVLATNSEKPLFNGRLVQPGTHVNAIGAALPTTREVDTHLVAKSFLAVDSIPQATSTYGDIMIPIREGGITREDLNELGALLIHPGRIPKGQRGITLFKSGGLAVLDAAFANHIITRLATGPRRKMSK